MEALPFLALGLPSSSCYGSTHQMTHGLFSVMSSRGGRNAALHDVPCAGCGILFSQHGMARHQNHFQAYQVFPPWFFMFFFGPLPHPP